MISATRVSELFEYALFQEHEVTPDGSRPLDEKLLATAQGVLTDAGFHKERLELTRDEVKAFLAQLPLNFRSDKNLPHAGGAWSFLQVGTLASGDEWTTDRKACEQLLLLGGGLGYVKRIDNMPVAFLPGAVPYFSIDLSAGTEQPTPTTTPAETLN